MEGSDPARARVTPRRGARTQARAAGALPPALRSSHARAQTRDDAAALDAADPLAPLRDEFVLPDGVVYLDGNSLGALPRRAIERVQRGRRPASGARASSAAGTTHGWIDLPARVAAKIAPLIGAAPSEVAVADSTSVNVFKLLAGALRLRPGRRVIVSERENFPTDLYVAQGLSALLGDVELRLVRAAELAGALDERRRRADAHARRLPDRRAARHARAHRARRTTPGALALWDLAHSAGALPVDLDGLRGRPRRRLRLQVPERRPGRAGLRVRRRAAAGGVRDAARRLDGPRRAVRLRHRATGPRRASRASSAARRRC